jgi:Entner-Doudoroff aldolase
VEIAMTNARENTVEDIRAHRICAIIRAQQETVARDAMNAAVAGGFRMIEFTLNTPAALELIAEFAARSDLLVGAGTVMSPAQADDAVRAGARFIVSPVFDADVVRQAAKLDVVSVPSAFTPTEMVAANAAGADLIKVFPAPPDIPTFLRQVLGPLPHLRLFPTAGVTPENFVDVLKAGAFGVGFVSSLFRPVDLSTRIYKPIELRATEVFRRLAEMG